MNWNKYLLLIIFLLVIIPAGFSAPVFQLSDDETGLQIFYPKIQYYPVDSNISFSFAVLNSTHSIQTDTEVDCDFYLENAQGESVVNGAALDFSTDYFSYTLNETQNNERGDFNYFTYCNSSTEAGAVSGNFYVNGSGDELLLQNTILYMGLMGLIFLILLFCIFGAINTENLVGKFAYVQFAWYFFIFFLFSLWQISNAYFMTLTFIINLSQTFFYIFMGLSPIFVICSIIFIYLYVASNRVFHDLITQGLDQKGILEREGSAFFKWFWRRK